MRHRLSVCRRPRQTDRRKTQTASPTGNAAAGQSGRTKVKTDDTACPLAGPHGKPTDGKPKPPARPAMQPPDSPAEPRSKPATPPVRLPDPTASRQTENPNRQPDRQCSRWTVRQNLDQNRRHRLSVCRRPRQADRRKTQAASLTGDAAAGPPGRPRVKTSNRAIQAISVLSFYQLIFTKVILPLAEIDIIPSPVCL